MKTERVAILSDIHGNLEALQAVMDDLWRRRCDRIFCLGDTVGYGPHPAECLTIARERFALVLQGNHEHGLIHGAENFNPVAKEALEWCRRQVADPALVAFLRTLRPAKLDGRTLFVHASARDPLQDYVREITGRDSFEALVESIKDEFTRFDLCFVGHNHKAFLGTTDGLLYPHDEVTRFSVEGQKMYVCVGSVGQPRDNDTRACYVLFDGESVEYHRVAYDVEKTARDILQAGLPEFLAERLYIGK
ncbi:MAG: metallophosphoesterase family protein [Planctomycetota bacterium]